MDAFDRMIVGLPPARQQYVLDWVEGVTGGVADDDPCDFEVYEGLLASRPLRVIHFANPDGHQHVLVLPAGSG